MTKEEWKVLYSAARMLMNARNYRDGNYGFRIDYQEPHRKIVWDICYYKVREMHPCMLEAVFDTNTIIYPLRDNKWAVKQNSKCFNRREPIRESKLKWRT